VPPKNIESERCFSARGSIVTNLRPCLDNEPIVALPFQRLHFNNKE
jgi:hypothetical protein